MVPDLVKDLHAEESAHAKAMGWHGLRTMDSKRVYSMR